MYGDEMRCTRPFEEANAEALKDQGNAKFQAHAYREAIQLYSKAISAAPGVASYYGNRGGGGADRPHHPTTRNP